MTEEKREEIIQLVKKETDRMIEDIRDEIYYRTGTTSYEFVVCALGMQRKLIDTLLPESLGSDEEEEKKFDFPYIGKGYYSPVMRVCKLVKNGCDLEEACESIADKTGKDIKKLRGFVIERHPDWE